jgi:hypothetical protein
MKKDQPKTKLKDIEDDGRTIADMNVEGMPWYMGKKQKKNKKELGDLGLTKEEKKAMFLGMIEAMAPIAIVGVVLFTIIYAFLYFVWLG